MQTLKTLWLNFRKYSGLLIGLLIAGLTFIVLGRKPEPKPVVPSDADRDGKDDKEQVVEIKEQAEVVRDNAKQHAEAAVAATQKPTAVKPSKNVQDAVQRNNDADY